MADFLQMIMKDWDKWEKEVAKIEKNVNFATASGLTSIAKKCQQEEIAEMKRVFDKPTSYTLSSTFIKPADKKAGDIVAYIGIKDGAFKAAPASRWLSPQIIGGTREHKRSEGIMIRNGIITYANYAMPAQQFKNGIPKGQLQAALSHIGSQRDSYQNTTNKSKKMYFAGKIGNTRGIWQRHGPTKQRKTFKRNGKTIRRHNTRKLLPKKVKPFMVFTRAPIYRKRFDFYGVAERTINKYGDDLMYKAFDKAFKTAW